MGDKSVFPWSRPVEGMGRSLINGELVDALGPIMSEWMSLREHYAGLAMQGMLAGESEEGGYWQPNHAAKRACEMADALIAALEAK